MRRNIMSTNVKDIVDIVLRISDDSLNDNVRYIHFTSMVHTLYIDLLDQMYRSTSSYQLWGHMHELVTGSKLLEYLSNHSDKAELQIVNPINLSDDQNKIIFDSIFTNPLIKNSKPKLDYKKSSIKVKITSMGIRIVIIDESYGGIDVFIKTKEPIEDTTITDSILQLMNQTELMTYSTLTKIMDAVYRDPIEHTIIKL
jgi:hypothetical protein